jgi:hypothetical protein
LQGYKPDLASFPWYAKPVGKAYTYRDLEESPKEVKSIYMYIPKVVCTIISLSIDLDKK